MTGKHIELTEFKNSNANNSLAQTIGRSQTPTRADTNHEKREGPDMMVDNDLDNPMKMKTMQPEI